MKLKMAYLCMTVALGLGLTLGVLWLLGGSPLVARADPGIRYVAPTGDDADDCTNSGSPCRTVQYAVDQAADGDEIHVATGVYTDVNNHGGLAQVVYISKTVTVRGGYSADFAAWDPNAHPATLDAQGNGRVIYVKGSINPTIESLRITGGNDDGLEGGYHDYDAGGGIYIRYADAVISDCVISQNASSHSGGGVYLRQSAAKLINNVIQSNDSNKYSGGVHLYSSPATLTGNTIQNNTADDNGGGIYADSTFTACDNLIQNNTTEAGGGLYIVGANDSLIEANTIQSNTVTWAGGGMYVQGSQNVALTGNTFQYNVAQYTGSSSGYGGGLVMYCGGPHTLQGNIFRSNTAERNGGGIYFDWCDSPYNHATMVNNVLVDNQAAGEGGAIYSYRGGTTPLIHTTLARNTGNNGVYVTSGSTLVFTNTIVCSHTVGVNNAGGTVSMAMTLWDSNDTDTAGTVGTSGDIPGTAAFDADGYHLTAASDAIDQGVDAGVTDDIDGQTRPMGPFPDLGADEYAPQADLSLSKVRDGSGPVNAGDPITFTLTITNAATSELAADARVVDTVEPASAVSDLSASTPGGDCTAFGAVVTCTAYNVATDTQRLMTVWVTTTATYEGVLTDTATVTPTNAVEMTPTNNTAGPVTVTVVYVPPYPDLWVDKAAPAYAKPGETITYAVTWGNDGGATATSATLTDTLPDGVSFVAASPSQDSGPNPLVWNLGNAAPGAGGTHIVTVTVNGGLSDGTVLTNTAVISSVTTSVVTTNNTAVATTTVYQLGGYDLSVTKEEQDASGPVELGDWIEYLITITNTGQLAANVTLNDAIPAGTEYVPGSALAYGDASPSNLDDSDGIVWEGNLGAGGVEWIEFKVEVVAAEGVDCGLISNEADVTIKNVGYHWLSTADTHVRSPDLTVDIAAQEHVARKDDGSFTPYEVTVTFENKNDHDYPGAAYTTTLTVTIPSANAVFVESDWPPDKEVNDRKWVWNLGTVNAGASDSINLEIQPDAQGDGDYRLHAEITGLPEECCQPNHPNQDEAWTYRVDMGFQKEAKASKWMWLSDPQSGEINGRYEQEYYLDFCYHNTNPGRPDMAGYSVTDTLPSELTFDSAVCQPVADFQMVDDQTVVWSMLPDFPLHVDDRAWMRLKGESGMLDASKVLTNRATLSYTLSAQEQFTNSAVATSTMPLFPPLITHPGDGELCGNEFGQVEVHGLAQPNVVVKLFVDINGGGFEEEDSTTADADGIFHLMSSSTIPEGLADTLKLYTKACNPADPIDCSAPSNQVEVWDPQGNWCPQLSYWEGTVKSGPLKGQYMHFGFRDGDGLYSTTDWVAPGVFGFWDTDLYLYACCGSLTAEIVVTADGIEYQPVDVNGKWHHFHIDKAHNVEICSACGSEEPVCTDGDILIDPDGYVFNVDKGGDYSGEGGMYSPVEAISGVTVTCMISMPTWGGWVPWPAHLYEDQVNPQVTDDIYPDGITTTGYYAFFTPPGFYYIDVQEIEGYQEWRSPVVEVITEIVHVNVPYTPWPAGDVYTVTITADGPDPAVITVPMGSAVEWTSALRATDTITDLITWTENPILRPLSDLDPLEDTRGFDAGYLEPGRVYRREFARSGVYAYTDAAGHGGIVVVEAALDSDGDGVPDVVEDRAPNGGDGNDDGFLDSQQANVASLPNAVDGRYVTLESPGGTNLVNVQAVGNPSPGDAPPLDFPHGFFSFTIEGLALGGTAVVTITLPDNVPIDTQYWKYHNNNWIDVTSLLGDNDGDNVLTLTLTDGGLGDSDGIANGEITDPGGPGQLPPQPPVPVGGVVVPVDKLGLLAPWLGLAALASFATLGVVLVRRRRGG